MTYRVAGLEPAFSIIKKLGGPQRVAEITGNAVTAPYRWTKPVIKGGTGGVIPHWHIPKILAFARDRGIALEAGEFVTIQNAA